MRHPVERERLCQPALMSGPASEDEERVAVLHRRRGSFEIELRHRRPPFRGRGPHPILDHVRVVRDVRDGVSDDRCRRPEAAALDLQRRLSGARDPVGQCDKNRDVAYSYESHAGTLQQRRHSRRLARDELSRRDHEREEWRNPSTGHVEVGASAPTLPNLFLAQWRGVSAFATRSLDVQSSAPPLRPCPHSR